MHDLQKSNSVQPIQTVPKDGEKLYFKCISKYHAFNCPMHLPLVSIKFYQDISHYLHKINHIVSSQKQLVLNTYIKLWKSLHPFQATSN